MVKEIIIGLFALLVTGFIALQFKSFKNWLVYGVSEAEQYLGSGTGMLKLRYTYDLAITRYPFITKIITFDMFSKFVDVALEKMKEMIKNSVAIEKILEDTKLIDVE